jgi:hypothetical protein
MRRQPPLVLAGVLCLVSLIAPPPVSAQVAGAVMGRVLDPAGLGVAGATVAVSPDDGTPARVTTTDISGSYRVADLRPRVYRVTASAPGFEPARQHVDVAVDSTVTLLLHLNVAGFTQAVHVVAEATAIDPQGSSLSLVIARDRLAALPLNRRDFLQLSLLSPGVAPPVEDSELSSRGSFAMHVSGGREEFNDYLLDGVDNNDPYVNRYVVQPPIDAIQEFKVATSSYSAEYGRNAAGQVNVVTRAGSSTYDGVVYEYFRDEALDARNYFAGDSDPPFRRDQAGMGFGGPIARGRAFFFGTVDWLLEHRGLSRLATVPTLAQRAGDLSALGIAVLDPFTRQAFPGNVIPAERISPVARRVLEAFPLPNREGPINYLGQPAGTEDQLQGHIRIDLVPSARDQLTVRYSGGRVEVFEPYAEDAAGVPGFGDSVDDRPVNATVQYQRVMGTRAVNQLKIGFNQLARDLLPENHGVDAAGQWGVDWLEGPSRASAFPSVTVAGFARVGDATSLPIVRQTRTWHVSDSLTLDRGAHLVRLGGELRHARLESTLDLLTRGSLSFSGALTGSGIGDLLLGLPSFALRATADNPMHLRSNLTGLFVQDEWHPRPDVTVNLGVRYEYGTPPADPTDLLEATDPAARLIAASAAGAPANATVQGDRNNIAPRAGLAWSVRRSTVLRAGYGLFYDAGMLSVSTAQYFNPPLFSLRMYFPSAQRLLTLQNPFPTEGGLAPPPALNLLNPQLQASSMHHWNAGLEHDVGAWGLARISYAGSRGLHLVQARDLNQPRPAEGPVQLRRPYPAYGSIFFVDSRGTSSYHALQATLDRRWSTGWSWLAAYTLSTSSDENSAFLETGPDRNFPQDSQNLAAERGPSSFDCRHRLVLAMNVDLPRRHALSRDTQIRTLATIQSGRPFTPVLRFDNSNTGNNGGTTGSDRPNLVGDPSLANPRPDRWIDTSAFVVPPRYRFGDAGRNQVRGPGYASVDVSVVRRFAAPGSVTVSVEVQVFNAFNHGNFDLPQMYVDEPETFGRIFSAGPPRQVQLAARVEF